MGAGVEGIALFDPSVEEEEENYLHWMTPLNIIVPFCHGFAMAARRRRIYFVAELLPHFVGAVSHISFVHFSFPTPIHIFG